MGASPARSKGVTLVLPWLNHPRPFQNDATVTPQESGFGGNLIFLLLSGLGAVRRAEGYMRERERKGQMVITERKKDPQQNWATGNDGLWMLLGWVHSGLCILSMVSAGVLCWSVGKTGNQSGALWGLLRLGYQAGPGAAA